MRLRMNPQRCRESRNHRQIPRQICPKLPLDSFEREAKLPQRPLRMTEEGDNADEVENENDDNDEDLWPVEGFVCETVASNDSIPPSPAKVARRTSAETPSHLAPEEQEEENHGKARTRRPRNLPPGCKGDWKRSQLERSVGRTRAVFNECLDILCLMAKFGMGVVCKQGNRVSHLTLNRTTLGIICPGDTTKLARRRNPASDFDIPVGSFHSKQPEEVVPIFWACDNKHGGALCHYVGHYRYIGLTKTDSAVMLLKNARQALIEFEFIQFDESLAQRFPICQNQYSGGSLSHSNQNGRVNALSIQ